MCLEGLPAPYKIVTHLLTAVNGFQPIKRYGHPIFYYFVTQATIYSQVVLGVANVNVDAVLL